MKRPVPPSRRIAFSHVGDESVVMAVPSKVAMALVENLLARARWPVWLSAVGLFLAGLGAMAQWFSR